MTLGKRRATVVARYEHGKSGGGRGGRHIGLKLLVASLVFLGAGGLSEPAPRRAGVVLRLLLEMGEGHRDGSSLVLA